MSEPAGSPTELGLVLGWANLRISEVILVVAVTIIQFGKVLAFIFAGGFCVAVAVGFLFKRGVAHGPLLTAVTGLAVGATIFWKDPLYFEESAGVLTVGGHLGLIALAATVSWIAGVYFGRSLIR